MPLSQAVRLRINGTEVSLPYQVALAEILSIVRVDFGEPLKRKRPKLFRVMGRQVEQPSPEVCSQPPYLLTRNVGMAPTGYC